MSPMTPLPITHFTATSALGCGLLWHGAPLKTSKAGQWVVAALLLLVGFTLLQLVSLPAAVVRVVAPENADIWSRALRPFQEAAPSFHASSRRASSLSASAPSA